MGRKSDHVGRRLLLVAALLALAPVQVSAQENGVKVGTGRLHPSLDFETRYDSYVAFAARSTGAPETPGEIIFHVRPGLLLEADSPTLAVRLDAKGDYNGYSGLLAPSSPNLSYFGGQAALALDVNPSGQLGLQVGDNFIHSDRTSAVALGAGLLSFYNEAYVRLPIRPGGGALVLTPAYALVFEAFIDSAVGTAPVADPADLNYLSHRPALQASWRFLPKTSFVVDVRGDIRGTDGEPRALYATAGISGLLTPKIALVLKAGYGNTFLADKQVAGQAVADYSSAIGQAELSYIVSETIKFKVGYVRTFEPVPQLAYYDDNRFYANAAFLIHGRFLGQIQAAFDLVNYATGRVDAVAEVGPLFSYRITDWLNAGAGYLFSTRQSGEVTSGPLEIDDYTRHEVFGRIGLVY